MKNFKEKIEMEINNWIEAFKSIREKDVCCRDMSYEICREFFMNNYGDKNKEDEIALHLYAFLASWGMLRNSFLLKTKNYRFLKPVVAKLCAHACLLNWEPEFTESDNDFIKEIMVLKGEIIACFNGQTFYEIKVDEKGVRANEERIKSVTDTLVTKIILGTLGCVPAYDSYFLSALRKRKETDKDISLTLNEKSLRWIIKFAKENQDNCKSIREAINNELYTTMRIVDMLLWWEGYKPTKKDNEEERNKPN